VLDTDANGAQRTTRVDATRNYDDRPYAALMVAEPVSSVERSPLDDAPCILWDLPTAESIMLPSGGRTIEGSILRR